MLWIGLGVNLLLWAFTALVPLAEPVTRGIGSWWWKDWSGAAWPLSVAVGLLVVYVAPPRTRVLEATAFTVAALNLVLGIAVASFARPDMLLGFWVALILFVTAALLPWDIRWQTALALLAVASSVGFLFLARSVDPAVQEFWAGSHPEHPARGFTEQVLLGTLGTGPRHRIGRRRDDPLQPPPHRVPGEAPRKLRDQPAARRRRDGAGIRGGAPAHVPAQRREGPATGPGRRRDGLARFEREVRLASSLTHPNTITIFDFGRGSDDTFYYAMEYLDGLDLQRFVERYGPTPANRSVYIMLQVAASLGEAHARGIIHRDLKPSNVFLTMRGGCTTS